MNYYIVDLDRTRVSESVVFWRENAHGYTVDVNDAGKYTREQSIEIVRNRDKHNVAIPIEAFDPSRFVTVVVHSHLAEILPCAITSEQAIAALAAGAEARS